MTQAELLAEMTNKTKRDCEESHRLIIMSLNGTLLSDIMIE
jgi:hypothetical protein